MIQTLNHVVDATESIGVQCASSVSPLIGWNLSALVELSLKASESNIVTYLLQQVVGVFRSSREYTSKSVDISNWIHWWTGTQSPYMSLTSAKQCFHLLM